MSDRLAEGTGTLEDVLIRIAVIVVALIAWLALVFNAERQARSRRAKTQAAEPTEANHS
jgi:hypothetical protein